MRDLPASPRCPIAGFTLLRLGGAAAGSVCQISRFGPKVVSIQSASAAEEIESSIAGERLEVELQLARRLVATLPEPLQRPHHDPLELGRVAGHDVDGGGDFAVQHRFIVSTSLAP